MHRKPVASGLFAVPARRGFLLASMLPLSIASANALEFGLSDGEIAGRFDNTLSYGVAFRTQGADRNLAAETAATGPTGYYSELAARNIKTQANKNDGNLNFPDAGELVSNTVKWNSLLELTWGNYGAQVSGFAFYDFALADIDGKFGPPSQFSNSVTATDVFDNRRLPKEAADYAVSDVRLSTAYVWGDFEVGDRTLNVRVGEQVVSWGEALFMQDGINQVNPADLSALRLPGAEIKDALLPLPMLVMSTSLTDSLSAEAFYQFGWNRSEADPVGTFYSTTDAFFGYGSKSVIIDVENFFPTPTGYAGSCTSGDFACEQYEFTQNKENLARIYNAYHRGIVNPADPMGSRLPNGKLPDVKPEGDGQFGLALRYMATDLNNTEFGFYFLNYHARKPTAGAVLGEAFGAATDPRTCAAAFAALASIGVAPADCADTMNVLGGSQGDNARKLVAGINSMHYLDSSTYFLQYEQNLQVYGLTFSANVGATSLSGEIAYRPDAEFLPEVGDNLIAYNALNAPLLANGLSSSNFGQNIGGGAALSAGQTVQVTENEDMVNVSLLAIHNFGPTWIADGLTGVLELGGAWVNGLDSGRRYAAEGALGYVPELSDTNGDNIPDAQTLAEGNPSQYLDDFAWGYRLVIAADFNNVAGMVMKPQLRFAHDVKGNGVVGGNFMEDRMSATVAVDFEYSGSLMFGVGANTFWGRDGLNEGNQLSDRDNVFASVKYSF